MNKNVSEISWRTSDHKKQKKQDWFWVYGSINILIVFALCFFLQEYSFAGVLFVVMLILMLAHSKKNKPIKYKITKDSFVLNNGLTNILYSDIKEYNIDKKYLKILINTKLSMEPLIIIPIKKKDIKKIDQFLILHRVRRNKKLKLPFMYLWMLKWFGII